MSCSSRCIDLDFWASTLHFDRKLKAGEEWTKRLPRQRRSILFITQRQHGQASTTSHHPRYAKYWKLIWHFILAKSESIIGRIFIFHGTECHSQFLADLVVWGYTFKSDSLLDSAPDPPGHALRISLYTTFFMFGNNKLHAVIFCTSFLPILYKSTT